MKSNPFKRVKHSPRKSTTYERTISTGMLGIDMGMGMSKPGKQQAGQADENEGEDEDEDEDEDEGLDEKEDEDEDEVQAARRQDTAVSLSPGLHQQTHSTLSSTPLRALGGTRQLLSSSLSPPLSPGAQLENVDGLHLRHEAESEIVSGPARSSPSPDPSALTSPKDKYRKEKGKRRLSLSFGSDLSDSALQQVIDALLPLPTGPTQAQPLADGPCPYPHTSTLSHTSSSYTQTLAKTESDRFEQEQLVERFRVLLREYVDIYLDALAGLADDDLASVDGDHFRLTIGRRMRDGEGDADADVDDWSPLARVTEKVERTWVDEVRPRLRELRKRNESWPTGIGFYHELPMAFYVARSAYLDPWRSLVLVQDRQAPDGNRARERLDLTGRHGCLLALSDMLEDAKFHHIGRHRITRRAKEEYWDGLGPRTGGKKLYEWFGKRGALDSRPW